MKENCVNCKEMKVLPFITEKEKNFRCVMGHLMNVNGFGNLYSKYLNSKGEIDGMTHRLEFKKAKTCMDFDDMRPDEFDKALKVWMEGKIFPNNMEFENIIGIYQMSGTLPTTIGEAVG